MQLMKAPFIKINDSFIRIYPDLPKHCLIILTGGRTVTGHADELVIYAYRIWFVLKKQGWN